MRQRDGNRRVPTSGPARPRRRVRRLLRAAAVVLACLGVLWALDRPIRVVRVSGTFRHVSPQAIERAVAAVALGAGLLTVHLGRVRAAVAALPWVATVSVRRMWPDALAVRISEQVAAACWNGDGLVNRDGKVFVTGLADPPAGLARLWGPPGTSRKVMRRYLGMRGQLVPSGLTIVSLALSARGAWKFTLNDGIRVRLGRSDLGSRFDKFVDVALAIVERHAQAISYVDMRYMNGFAIGWRHAAPAV
jgi:cell division protein FtsQ